VSESIECRTKDKSTVARTPLGGGHPCAFGGPSVESKCDSLLDEVQPYSEGYLVLLQDIYSLELE